MDGSGYGDEYARESGRASAVCLTCDRGVEEPGTCCLLCTVRADAARIAAKHAARAFGLLPPRGDDVPAVSAPAPRVPTVPSDADALARAEACAFANAAARVSSVGGDAATVRPGRAA